MKMTCECVRKNVANNANHSRNCAKELGVFYRGALLLENVFDVHTGAPPFASALFRCVLFF